MTGIFNSETPNLHHFIPLVVRSPKYIQQFPSLPSQWIATVSITPPEFINVEEIYEDNGTNNSGNLSNLALRRNNIFQEINQQKINSGRFTIADAGNMSMMDNKTVKVAARYSSVKPQTMPILGFGSSGLSVRILQRLLLSNGYGVSVDGIFGPVTEVAVKAFQNRHSLSADGIVGDQTWWKLTR